MKILLMTIVVMGLVLGGIIYFNEKKQEEKVQQVATVSLVLGEDLPKVNKIGISIGEDFEQYTISEVQDTTIDNIAVLGEGVPNVRLRYYYENGSFLEIEALDRFVNQGLSGTNEFVLYQDSVGYLYRN